MDRVERHSRQKEICMHSCRARTNNNQSGSPGVLDPTVPQSRRLPRAKLEKGRVKVTGLLISTGESYTDSHFGKLTLRTVWNELRQRRKHHKGLCMP